MLYMNKVDCRYFWVLSCYHCTRINKLFSHICLFSKLFSTEICPFYSGGGWTLVVSISSKNNDYLQKNLNNCLNSVLCVPAPESVIKARKLSDDDIRKLALAEGRKLIKNEQRMFLLVRLHRVKRSVECQPLEMVWIGTKSEPTKLERY